MPASGPALSCACFWSCTVLCLFLVLHCLVPTCGPALSGAYFCSCAVLCLLLVVHSLQLCLPLVLHCLVPILLVQQCLQLVLHCFVTAFVPTLSASRLSLSSACRHLDLHCLLYCLLLILDCQSLVQRFLVPGSGAALLCNFTVCICSCTVPASDPGLSVSGSTLSNIWFLSHTFLVLHCLLLVLPCVVHSSSPALSISFPALSASGHALSNPSPALSFSGLVQYCLVYLALYDTSPVLVCS